MFHCITDCILIWVETTNYSYNCNSNGHLQVIYYIQCLLYKSLKGIIFTFQATAKDLHSLENRLQKSLSNISVDVEENLQSIEVLGQNLEQVVKS